MILRAATAVLLVAAGLSACNSSGPRDANVAAVAGAQRVGELQVERVEVIVDPAAEIIWPAMREEFARSTGTTAPSATDRAVDEPTRAYVERKIRDQVKAALEPSMRSQLTGSKRVIAQVRIRAIRILGFGQAFAIGMLSAEASYMRLVASVELVDPKTKASLAAFPSTLVSAPGSSAGIRDPIDVLLFEYRDRLTAWLARS